MDIKVPAKAATKRVKRARFRFTRHDSTRTREGTEISDYAGRQAEDSAMSFRMLRGNPLNPLHFPPNFLKMALACQNALRQMVCPVPSDVVYAFVLSLGRVYHSRVKASHNFRLGEKRTPEFFTCRPSPTVSPRACARERESLNLAELNSVSLC
jgi:hypothetical protein